MHKDIKPANYIFTPSKQLKVIDFSEATDYSSSEYLATYKNTIQERLNVGTDAY